MRVLFFYIIQILTAIGILTFLIAGFPIAIVLLWLGYVFLMAPLLIICAIISFVVLGLLHMI